jgi:maltooligosyltrehalose trehalohydrolase
MHEFRVWAPIPSKIEVEVRGERHAMSEAGGGWKTAAVRDAGPGVDYGFWVDDEGPFPDPRSPWQPAGVHGLSRLVDHASFEWNDHDFRAPPLSSAIVYELHIGTFTPEGTFGSAAERLDHLVELGVTHVEVMPVNAFSGRHGWGYDGVALFAVHEPYGGPEGLKRFVNACHQRGLAVILDVVYNHFGPTGNYLGKYGPYFNSRYQTPWGWAVNFDGPHSGEVRRFCCDNALMWFRDYHVDALRLDAVHAILDTSAQPFLEELALEVRELEARLARPLAIIAESDLNDPRLLWPRERGGFALDAQWCDDFHHALHSALTGERGGYYQDFGSLEKLAKALRNAYVFDGQFSPHRGRRHGRPHGGLSGHRFLGYIQNHDQVGNRAQGDRLSQFLNPGQLKIAAALTLTSPFIPMLFMGEEWGAQTAFQYFTDHAEPELGAAVREGRRLEFAAFGWAAEDVPDPQAPETFERSRLRWEELAAPVRRDLLKWHQDLIRLRRSEPSLMDGRMDAVETRYDEEARWMVVRRGTVAIICNFNPTPTRAPLPRGVWLPRLSSFEAPEWAEDEIALPGHSVVVAVLAAG